jgi:hypothetical protein
MKFFHLLFALFLTSASFAEMNLYQGAGEPKLSVKNTILAKVNGNTISVIDVMKKMDMLLHQRYPQYAESPQARYQFYSSSWRTIFMEMIDTELMLSDAQDKEVKLTDGEIREEMENRFGPNVTATLEKIGLPYPDAWKMVKNELIVRRMMWFFVHSKAMQTVSPQAIRQAYRDYLSANPPYREWVYRVISLRSDIDAAALAEDLYRLCSTNGQNPESADWLKTWEIAHPDCKIQISNEFVAKETELSDSHKTTLATLAPGHYSTPVRQVSRSDNHPVYRIFYLGSKNDHPAPPFETLSNQLKNDLMQKSVAKESDTYMQKLRKHYGFDPARIKETVPDDFQPFHLE